MFKNKKTSCYQEQLGYLYALLSKNQHVLHAWQIPDFMIILSRTCTQN